MSFPRYRRQPFHGEVVSWDASAELWVVKFDDGDLQWLGDGTVRDLVAVTDQGIRVRWAPAVGDVEGRDRTPRHTLERLRWRKVQRARCRAAQRQAPSVDAEFRARRETAALQLEAERWPHRVNAIIEELCAQRQQSDKVSRLLRGRVDVANLRNKAALRALVRAVAERPTAVGAPSASVLAAARRVGAGPGFDSDRSRRRHVKALEEELEQKYPEDVTRQAEVVAALARHFGVDSGTAAAPLWAAGGAGGLQYDDGRPVAAADLRTAAVIGLSLRKLLVKLRATAGKGRTGRGRPDNKSRCMLHAAVFAAAEPAGTNRVSSNELARFLGVHRRVVREEKERRTCYEKGGGAATLLTHRGRRRSDAFPFEWVTFTELSWLAISRKSELTRDEIIDPNDRTTTLRKHYCDLRLKSAIVEVRKLCVAHFKSPDFEYEDGIERPDGMYTPSETPILLSPTSLPSCLPPPPSPSPPRSFTRARARTHARTWYNH